MRDNTAATSAVKRAIAATGLTREQFASSAGISANTLRTFLNGQRWANTATLSKIEDALGWPRGRAEDIASGLASAEQGARDAPAPVNDPVDLTDLIAVTVNGSTVYIRPNPKYTREEVEAMAPVILAAVLRGVADATAPLADGVTARDVGHTSDSKPAD
jgi:transcriptional regulator with XRE-family HTH domain